MIPNKTYELRNLYFQQNAYSTQKHQDKYCKPPLLQWPSNGFFEKLKPDADLLQKALKPETNYERKSISEQIFGNQMKLQYVGLKHTANLFYERCKLHKQHIQGIDCRHIETQEKKFGVEINNFPDKGKRLSNLENQLLQLESQRRDEELGFWKDTVVLVQRELDKSTFLLRDFSCLRQIMKPPSAGLFLSGFLRHFKALNCLCES